MVRMYEFARFITTSKKKSEVCEIRNNNQLQQEHKPSILMKDEGRWPIVITPSNY